MPLKLHDKARECLVAALVPALEKIKVRHGSFVHVIGGAEDLLKAERILPKNGKLHEQIESYIGDHPLFISYLDCSTKPSLPGSLPTTMRLSI